jgi:carboxymethylenebutenolidase
MDNKLTPAEQAISDLWDRHLGAEFGAHSPDGAMSTMVAEPRVNQVPVMIGGHGRAQLYEFYDKHFLSQIAPDMEMTMVSRTIGQGRLVDEVVARFTHTVPMMWLLPGVPPTGKRVEVVFVAIIQFEGDKIAKETLYWDHASLLAQVGLIDPTGLPIVGAEGARSVLDDKIPLNRLIDRAVAARK